MNSESACYLDTCLATKISLKIRFEKLLKVFKADMAVSSRKGSDGRPVNQDAVMLTGGKIPRIGVADGISKSNKGQIASKLAFLPFLLSPATCTKGLAELAVTGHALVTEIYRMFDEAKVGGTTLVVAELRHGAMATVLSIGDSRAYLLTPCGLFRRHYKCRQITVDQVYGELKKRIRLDKPEQYPDHVMYQSIGSGLVASEVVPKQVTIPAGGMLLLATDGLFKVMNNDCREIAEVVENLSNPDAQTITDALITRALELESSDDISVAVILPTYLLGARWPFWSGICAAVCAGGLLS